MPQIGEMTVTLKIWKEPVGSTHRYYASIVDKEQSKAIRELLKKHSGLNEHHLSLNIT